MILLAGLFAAAFGVYQLWAAKGNASTNPDVPTAVAKVVKNLPDKVVDQGELESQSTITGTCRIDDHENKIIFLAPEGSQVKKGQVVCRFDSSKFEGYVSEAEAKVTEEKAEVETAEQELKVQIDENASAIRAAKQAVEFAELDLKKYLKGDYEVKKSDLEGAISESETNVEKARRSLTNMRTLVKKGFREYEQLREAEQVVKSAELRLKRDKQKLDTLENFEHVKSEAEFRGKFEEAKHKLETAKTTAAAKLAKAEDRLKNEKAGLKIYERRLREYKTNLDRHEMKAPQDGTLVYARDNWRGSGEKIHEGKTIYQNQPVFVLPDMDKMQVKVGVHESDVGKVKIGHPAIILVDAFASMPLKGTVQSVALLSDSTRWQASNNYSVIVTISTIPDGLKIKPGMTAKVEILVGNYQDVLVVPIQAVASRGQKKYAFVQNSNGEFESRVVTIGQSNISFVVIQSGIEEGETVALDAYQRALTEFGDDEAEDETGADAFESVVTAENDDEGNLSAGDDGGEQETSDVGKTSEETESSGKESPQSENSATDSPKTENVETEQAAPSSTSDVPAQDKGDSPRQTDEPDTDQTDALTAPDSGAGSDIEDAGSAETSKSKSQE